MDGAAPRPAAARFEAWLDGIRRLVRDHRIAAEPRLEGPETLPDDLTARLRGAGLLASSARAAQPGFPALAPGGAALGRADFAPLAWPAPMAPAGTPEPVVARVAELLGAALRQAGSAARPRATGALPAGLARAGLRGFLGAGFAARGAAVRASGASVEG